MKKFKISGFTNGKGVKKRTVITGIVFLILITSCLSLFAGNYMATKGVFLIKTSPMLTSEAMQINDKSKYSALFEVRDTLMEKFDGEIDDNTLLEGAIKGMTNSLNDPYTVFMNNEEFDKLMKQSNGSITGIGVEVASKDNKITIISPIKGSPADIAGLKTDDVIEKVNDVALSGDELEKAVSMITANDKTQVKLTIKRGTLDSFDVNITTDKIKVESLDGEMLDSSLGYIHIKSFMNENTSKDFESKIKELQGRGMKGLIVDLRENPGGLLSEAVGVASQFIPKDKTVTYTIDKYNKRDESPSVGGIAEGMPLVLLVNGGSASASEVVTGALRDYGAATIVGNTTFGKGIVQQPIKFNDGIGGLKVTISKYYTPNGENIHKKGITPDFVIDTSLGINDAGYDKNKDAQLNLAIEKLKDKIK